MLRLTVNINFVRSVGDNSEIPDRYDIGAVKHCSRF